MEAYWVHKRVALWHLLQETSRPSDTQLAQELGMSRSWVQKWRPRIVEADIHNLDDFASQSRRRITSPKKVTEALEAKIIHYRETLTKQYHRRVGAKNILYHLQQDADLKQLGVYIPRSASTVHRVLVEAHRVPRPKPRVHVPVDRPDQMQVWEIDFTDVSTASSEKTDKKAHQVEVFDVVDAGSSVAIACIVSDHFDARYSLLTIIDIFRRGGMPQVIRLDRDPRLVGNPKDIFPSAFIKTLLCLGVEVDICPPRRPDLKPFVERFIRNQKEECIYPRRPANVTQAQLWIDEYRTFYNLERPNQAITCNNQPPSIAIGTQPALRRLPAEVQVDAWLRHYHRYTFERAVVANGTVNIDRQRYYIGKRYRGQRANIILDANERHFDIKVGNETLKPKPIRNLYEGSMNIDDFVDLMALEAQSEAKRLARKRRFSRRVA